MSDVLYTGRRGKYYWLEEADLSFHEVLTLSPEFVLRKYLVITAFDSGPLRLAREDFDQGWLQHDELAIHPSVRSVKEIPHHDFTEWVIFSKPPLLEDFKVFVNYSLFSLREPEHGSAAAGPTGDSVGIIDEAEAIKELQELFWLQLELKDAETYMSDGFRFTLATQNGKLYDRLIASIGRDSTGN